MAKPKPARRARDEDETPAPLEAGLRVPGTAPPPHEDEGADEYLLLKVVEANGEHLRTMRWGLGGGLFLLLVGVAFGPLLAASFGPLAAGLALFLVAGAFLGAGLHGLARQLELLRRAVAATDHFVFGPPEDPEG